MEPIRKDAPYLGLDFIDRPIRSDDNNPPGITFGNREKPFPYPPVKGKVLPLKTVAQNSPFVSSSLPSEAYGRFEVEEECQVRNEIS